MNSEIFLILAVLLILISFIMAVFNWKTNKNILFLSLFIVCLGIEGTVMWYFYTENSSIEIFAVLLNNFAPLYTLKAPLLYFFVRGNTRDDYRLSIIDYLHFIPAILHFILIIPYLMIPFSEKVEIARFIKENLHLYMSTDLNYPYPHIWNQYFRSIQLIVYTLVSVIILFRFRKITRGIPSQLRNVYRFSAVWIMILLSTFFMVGIFQFVMVIQPATTGDSINGLLNAAEIFRFSLILYILIPLILLVYPRFMYGFPSFRIDMSDVNSGSFVTRVPEGAFSGTSYSSRIVDNLDLLLGDMKNLIEKELLYLDPEFKLTTLSELMNVPTHQLVLCLSIKKHKTFDDFINEYRIKHVIELVKVSREHQSPELLSVNAGFLSVTDFLKAFSKYTGLTFRNWYTMTLGK